MAYSDPGETDDLLLLLNAGTASREVRRFAARGLLPLDRDDRIRAILAVLDDADPELSGQARSTLEGMPPDELSRFVERPAATSEELDAIARVSDDSLVLEQIVRHRNISDETLEFLARRVSGAPQEALIVNQVRLLRRPALIDALFSNPSLTAEGRRLLNEIREEFFEKEKRRREAERTVETQAALARLREELASEREERDEEGEDDGGEDAAPAEQAEEDGEISSGELYLKIMRLTVPERVKLAQSGGKEERRLLIADANKLVAYAVLKGRGVTITEVEGFCGMRHLDKDIFEKIAQTRDWIRRPGIMIALVKNPKVPLTITLPLLKRLSQRELKGIARDRNLPDALRGSARQLFFEKRH